MRADARNAVSRSSEFCELPYGRVFSLTWKMTLPVGEGDLRSAMTAYFVGASDAREDTCFCAIVRADQRYELHTRGASAQLPSIEGREFQVEMRYCVERGTCDVLVDNTLVIEESQSPMESPVSGVQFHAEAGTRVDVEHVRFAVHGRSLKRDLGSRVPLVLEDHLGLMPRVWLDADTDNFVVANLGSANKPTIVTGDRNTPGALSFLQLSGGFNVELQAEKQLVSDHMLRPVGIVGDSLAIFGFQMHDPQSGRYRNGFQLIDVDHALDCRPRYSSYLEETDDYRVPRAAITELGLSDGTRGFAVGYGFPERRVGVFGAHRHGDDDAYERVASFTPVAGGKAYDINSLVAWDCDGDTDDDLLLGWGHDVGQGPAVITLEHGTPDPNYPRRIAPEANCTQLAGDLDDDEPILVGAVQGDFRTAGLTGGGMWVWRLDKEGNSDSPELIGHLSGNIHFVSTGSLAGKRVVGFVTIEPHPVAEHYTVRLHIYGVDTVKAQIDELWDCVIPQVKPMARVQLEFVDVNGDRINEFVASIPGHGIYVFTLDRLG